MTRYSTLYVLFYVRVRESQKRKQGPFRSKSPIPPPLSDRVALFILFSFFLKKKKKTLSDGSEKCAKEVEIDP